MKKNNYQENWDRNYFTSIMLAFVDLYKFSSCVANAGNESATKKNNNF